MPSHLERIASSAVHSHPLRDAIHSFKYNNGRALARPLGAHMAAFWHQRDFRADLIVPVPLHAGRLAERGYNQSALLAHVLGNAVGVRVSEAVLIRHKATRHQVGLGRIERKQNVAGAFICRGDVAGRRIALIDDVCTTGSTLEACARALSAGGATSVWAFTLARARWIPIQGDAVPDPGSDPG